MGFVLRLKQRSGLGTHLFVFKLFFCFRVQASIDSDIVSHNRKVLESY